MTEWNEVIPSVVKIIENTTAIVRVFVERMADQKPVEQATGKAEALEAYKRRVRNRRKTGEFRPEWDLLGRVAFDHHGQQFLTEMDNVPQSLQNTMTGSIKSGRIRPGPEHAIEVSDENFIYLLEVGAGWPVNDSLTFVFWFKPAR